MKTFQQLLAEWEQGTLPPEGIEQLKQLLAAPEARAELVEDWLFHEAMYSALRSMPDEQPALIAAHEVQASPVQVSQAIPEATAETETPRRPAVRRAREAGWMGALQLMLPRLGWREVTISLRLAVGFAAVCVLIVVYAYQTAPLARVTAVRGKVLVQRGSASFLAQKGETLQPGDTVHVAADGAAALGWAGEGTALELAPGAEFQIVGRLRGKQLALRDGRLQAAVSPQSHWRPMVIQTPHAHAQVVGTRFSLAVGTNATRLEVTEGAVALRQAPTRSSGASAVTVRVGESAVASPGMELKAESILGCANWQIVSLPPDRPLFADSPGEVVWRGLVPKLAAIGRMIDFAPTDPNTYEDRIRGLVVPPTTGDYTFWIDSSNRSELWLSSDENPARRTRIAAVQAQPRAATNGKARPGALPWSLWVNALGSPANDPLQGRLKLSGDFNRSPSQKSAPQRLVAGQRYYLEVVHQFDPSDLVIVAWAQTSLPNAGTPGWIDGEALRPYFDPAPPTVSAKR